MKVRLATEADAPAIVGIANPIIRDTTVIFQAEARAPEVPAGLIAGGQPHWVAEGPGGVFGYATYFPFRGGSGYARVREHTVLLSPEGRGRGAGRSLMAALEAHAAAAGIHSLMAGVSGENADGIAFHAAIGFREVARVPEVGWKFGRWLDLVLMQKFLSAAPSER